MTWTAPVSPVSGTVITVAWATANVVDTQTWLRLMTGNADPPGSSYVVISSSSTSTAWGKVTGDAIGLATVTAANLASGAAVGNIGFTPIGSAGGTINGVLTISGTGAGIVLTGTSGLYVESSAGTTLRGPVNVDGTGLVTVSTPSGMVVSGAGGLAVTSSAGASVTNTLNAGTLQQGGVGVALATHVNHAGSLALDAGELVDFADELGAKLLLFSTTFGIGINSAEIVLYAPAGNHVVVRDGAYNGTLRGRVALQDVSGKVPAALAADSATAIADGAVSTSAKLAAAVITEAKIVDGNITTAKIADGNVTEPKLGAGSVSAGKLASGAAVSNIGYTPSRMLPGSYSGNSGALRQITTGFACSYVTIIAQDGTVYLVYSTSTAVRLDTAGGSALVPDVRLHASNGFVVGADPGEANTSGVTYTYFAFGA